MADARSARSAVERAQQRLAAGDVAAAKREAESVLASAVGSAEYAAAHLVLATCCDRAGQLAQALVHARAAIQRAPDDPIAHYVYAELQEQKGDKADALTSIRQALRLKPGFVQAVHYLGILLGESGDAAGAFAAFAETVRLSPGHARGWNNLGNAQRTLGRLDEAEQSFARAVDLKPDYWLAAANLGGVQRDLGYADRAEATLRAAVTRNTAAKPYRPLLVLLAGVLRLRGALDEAAQLYVRAINEAPEQSAAEWFFLGLVLSERNDTDQARDAFARSNAFDPSDLRSLLGLNLALPMIYADAADVEASRERFDRGMQALERDLVASVRAQKLTEAQLLDGFRWTNFFLAYQGQDDRSLQRRYADVVANAIDAVAPHWREPIAARSLAGRRIRIGFASAFFHTGTCGRYFKSWITDLDRGRFEVFVYHLWPGMDEVAEAIVARADHFRSYGGSQARPSVVAPVIRGDDLDVLVYTELGMDVTSFALAALRLAPRQYAAWGHPVTTGHRTIDAYLSCAAMEPDGAQLHYSEPLVTLPGLGTRYEKPAIPERSARAQLSLPEGKFLLLCPQSLWKIHPDNDALFARLLADNAEALLVFFGGRHPGPSDHFMRRLSAVFAVHDIELHERTLLLPQVGHDDYLRVNLACDAMIDTLHWSGGNTSLDALACGLPVVTLPGPYMRGRQSAGMLALLGVPELIARDQADYLAIALRLAMDPLWRNELSLRIRAGHDRLFDVSAPVERLHQLLQADDIASV